MGILDRIQHIWDQRGISEYERVISKQFQAIELFIRVLRLYVHPAQLFGSVILTGVAATIPMIRIPPLRAAPANIFSRRARTMRARFE